MNEKDLRPASHFARQYGVKALIYGEPGTGKTPLLNSAPNPVLLAAEPGLMSMATSNIPTYAAGNVAALKEFFTWLFQSKEASKYDTVGVDSISQVAEIVLADELKRQKDPRKAYGNMSQQLMEWANGLFFMQGKHAYLIAKQTTFEDASIVPPIVRKKPYFPGQDLNVKIPHLYDEILHLGKAIVPGVAMPTLAIRCQATAEIMARDRSGKCNELEPPNLGTLFSKIMS